MVTNAGAADHKSIWIVCAPHAVDVLSFEVNRSRDMTAEPAELAMAKCAAANPVLQVATVALVQIRLPAVYAVVVAGSVKVFVGLLALAVTGAS